MEAAQFHDEIALALRKPQLSCSQRWIGFAPDQRTIQHRIRRQIDGVHDPAARNDSPENAQAALAEIFPPKILKEVMMEEREV